MLKFAICDDEPYMAQEIVNQLSWYMNGEQITSYCVSSFQNGCSLLESDCNFDIVFLDIQMEHLNGMEMNRTLSSRQMKKRKLGHEGLDPENKGSQAL